MKKLIVIKLLFSVVCINLSIGQVPGNLLFDNSKIHEIRIVSLFENLTDTLTSNYMFSFGMNQFQIRPIPYAQARLVIDGTETDTIAIRYKGFNSWWHSVKKPIKIDLNRYKAGQEYDGLKKFNLHNGSGDPSFIRENIDYHILRSLGIKVPRTAFTKVFMDTTYLGIYRIVEQVDNTFLDVNFGNHKGNLYVQEAIGTAGFSLRWEGPVQDAYYESIKLENHQTENDWSGLIHFLDVLNNTSDKDFRDSILTVFAVDEYLQILAFDLVVNNLDFYGNSGRNYYLYQHDGVFHWIPWDYNLTWMEGEPPLAVTPADFPVLIKRILQVPEFSDAFYRKYCALKTYFESDYINQLVTGETSAISELMKDDPFQDYPFEAFQQNRDTSWQRIPGLKPFASKRYANMMETLESLQINCNNSADEFTQSQNLLKLYPMPARDWLTIGDFPQQEVLVSIFDELGQTVMTTTLFTKGLVNVSHLSKGCYIVNAMVGKQIFTRLLLVDR
jgi:hypothetical protein